MQVKNKGFNKLVKCNHCNHRTNMLYTLTRFDEKEFEDYGVCGECFAEMLVDGDYEIKLNH